MTDDHSNDLYPPQQLRSVPAIKCQPRGSGLMPALPSLSVLPILISAKTWAAADLVSRAMSSSSRNAPAEAVRGPAFS